MAGNTLEKSPWGSGSWDFDPHTIGLYCPSKKKRTLEVLRRDSSIYMKRALPSLRRPRRKLDIFPELEVIKVLLYSASILGFFMALLLVFSTG